MIERYVKKKKIKSIYLLLLVYYVIHVSAERLRVYVFAEAVNSFQLALVHAYASTDDYIFRYTSYFHALR